jgi:ATP-binding cassette subfamily B multidrug efflux pump
MLKILRRFKWIEWLQLAISIAFISSQVWLDLKLPDYMSEVTRLVQTPGSEMKEIWTTGGYMLLCAIGSLIAAFIVGFFAARLAATLAYRLRTDLYDKVESFSMEEIGQFSISSLITRSTNDITQVQMIVAMGLQVMIKAPIMATWAIIKISGKSWQWSMATGSAVVFLMALVSVIIIFALPKFKIIQKLIDNLNRITRENLTGVRVVRAYNAEDYQADKFETANNQLTKTNLFTGKLMTIMMPGMQLVMNGLSLSIYWIGAYLINNAVMGDKLGLFTDMIVYSSYAMQVVMSFMMLTMIFIILPRAAVSINRINEVLDTEPKIVDGILNQVPWIMGRVEFKNVSFKYPDASEYVLHNISFKAEPGETVAFIGSTGSGKSTLINLIPRFYDATEGEVLINGKNIKEYKQKDLHNKIGYVPQKAIIFSGTVKSNIDFGESHKKRLSLKEVKEAAAIAHASEFIEKMENTYDALVAQGGTNLSGGQKQRLAIARAIAREPEILIFDDSFSALDYKTDKKLREDLEKQKIGATTFIVAQRIGTIRNADKIVVLDEGEIVGVGSHYELIKDCSVYREIAFSQLSKEEVGYDETI